MKIDCCCQDSMASPGLTAGSAITPQEEVCQDQCSGHGPAAGDASSYLARLLTAGPTLRVAVLSHDSTKLYTGAQSQPPAQACQLNLL